MATKDKAIKREDLPASTLKRVKEFVEHRARHYSTRIAGLAAAVGGGLAYLAAHPSVWHALFHDLSAFLMHDIALFMLACALITAYAVSDLVNLKRRHDELGRHLAKAYKHHSHARVHDDHSITLTNRKPSHWQRAHWHHVKLS